MSFKIILFFFNLCLVDFCYTQITETVCRTPENDVGTCINIYDCTPITDLIKSFQGSSSIPPEIAIKIREYQCALNSDSIKVCCPSQPIAIHQNLSVHRNYKLLPINCGVIHESDDKIINGQVAGLSEFPWMALLSYKTRLGPQFKCGGAIINSRYILTAAHCIHNTKFPLLGVRIGEHNIPTGKDCENLPGGGKKCAPPVQDLSIEAIIEHPDYSPDQYINDIGLIRVSQIDLQPENTKPICLPFGDKQYMNIDGKLLIVTGWGLTEKSKNEFFKMPIPKFGFLDAASQMLLKVEVPIISTAECGELYKNDGRFKITEKHICAKGIDGKDACSGDSGGPLQMPLYHNGDVRYVIFGIVSFGSKFCDPNHRPGVYTRVGPYLPWILDNIKE